jgi:hypothetical protein
MLISKRRFAKSLFLRLELPRQCYLAFAIFPFAALALVQLRGFPASRTIALWYHGKVMMGGKILLRRHYAMRGESSANVRMPEFRWRKRM